MIILFLPGNFKTDIKTFHDVYKKRKDLLNELSEVYWVDEKSDLENVEPEIIDGLKHSIHTYTGSKNQNSESLQYVSFYDALNSEIITYMQIYKNSVCYYYNYREKLLKKIENLKLFYELFMRLSIFSDTLYSETREDVNIAESKDFFATVFKEAFQRISTKKNFYSITYSEKFFLNKFIDYYESKTGYVVRFYDAPEVFKIGKRENIFSKSNSVVITGITELDRDDQELLFKKCFNLFQRSKVVIFDLGKSGANNFLTNHVDTTIQLPNSDIIKTRYNPSGILLFILKELQKEIGLQLKYKSYMRLIGNQIIKDSILKNYTIPDIYQALKSALPKEDFTIDILDYNLWYQSLILVDKVKRVDYELEALMAEENLSDEGSSSTKKTNFVEPVMDVAALENKIVAEDDLSNVIEEIEHQKLPNSDQSYKPPYRIEKNGKIIKIFFNNIDLDRVGSTLIGWRYLAFLIINSNSNKKYDSLKLSQIINKEKAKRSNLISNDADPKLNKKPAVTERMVYIDKKAMVEYLDRLEELEDLSHSDKLDDDQLKKVNKEKEKLQKFINNNSRLVDGQNGKKIRVSKKEESDASKTSRAIVQALERILDPLMKEFPEAYAHFDEYLLKYKNPFYYNPPNGIEWNFDSIDKNEF